jgi:S1-C subfamily serine protease
LTVTAGIASAKKGRVLSGNYDNFAQIDPLIHPGIPSLFNTSGQVIGINTTIYSSTGTNGAPVSQFRSTFQVGDGLIEGGAARSSVDGSG